MTWNSVAILDALTAEVKALPQIENAAVYQGLPLSRDYTESVTVMGGSLQPEILATGRLYKREDHFFITYAYRLGSAPDAERKMLAFVDAVQHALLDDLTLGGLVGGLRIDTGPADSAEYQTAANDEYRMYPLLIIVTETATYPNP
jgi:hypothetical protein